MSEQPNDSPWGPLAGGFIIGAITVSTIFLVRNRESASHARASLSAPTIPAASESVASASASSALDAAVVRVAARFACSCGTCGEKRLDLCSCDTAQRERAFIQDQLHHGRSEAEAAEALNQKYGGLKSGPPGP